MISVWNFSIKISFSLKFSNLLYAEEKCTKFSYSSKSILILTLFSSKIDFICCREEVNGESKISLTFRYLVEILALSFISTLVLGPLSIITSSSSSSGIILISTLKVNGSDTCSENHKVSFICRLSGRGSYNFMNILGSVVREVSNRVLTPSKVILSPKFNKNPNRNFY